MHNSGIWFMLGAAITAGITTIGVILYEMVQSQNYQHSRGNLQREIKSLQDDLDKIRKLQKEQEELVGSKKLNRRKRVTSVNSVKSSDTYETARSTVDSDESEYYDVSSEASSDETESSFKEIDKELENATSTARIDSTLKNLREMDAENPGNQEVLWRIGKACKLRYELTTSDANKREFVNEGIAACEQAVSLRLASFNAYKWLAILYGIRCELQSNLKERIVDSNLFRQNIMRAIEMQPEDDTPHYLYGRYVYEISQLNWFERSFANTVLGEVPSCSVEQALDCFLKAERICPSPRRENRIYIAKCYVDLNEIENARRWLAKAEEVEADAEDSKIDNLFRIVKSVCK